MQRTEEQIRNGNIAMLRSLVESSAYSTAWEEGFVQGHRDPATNDEVRGMMLTAAGVNENDPLRNEMYDYVSGLITGSNVRTIYPMHLVALMFEAGGFEDVSP